MEITQGAHAVSNSTSSALRVVPGPTAMRDRDVRDLPGRVGAARHDMNNDAGTETCANCVLNLDHNQLASIPVAGTTVPVDRPSSHDRTLASSLDANHQPGRPSKFTPPVKKINKRCQNSSNYHVEITRCPRGRPCVQGGIPCGEEKKKTASTILKLQPACVRPRRGHNHRPGRPSKFTRQDP